MHFAHEHGKRGVVGTEKIHHLVQRHVRNQVTAQHQDVCLKADISITCYVYVCVCGGGQTYKALLDDLGV